MAQSYTPITIQCHPDSIVYQPLGIRRKARYMELFLWPSGGASIWPEMRQDSACDYDILDNGTQASNLEIPTPVNTGYELPPVGSVWKKNGRVVVVGGWDDEHRWFRLKEVGRHDLIFSDISQVEYWFKDAVPLVARVVR